MANVTKAGYTAPTPVQKYGIPVAFAGKDLMACAQTGSGKTAAFLIPIVNHVLVHGVSISKTRRALPIGIVMAPTRELALQIYDEARKMCFQTDVYTAVIYGGADGASQAAQLADGADVVVATPGRLKDMFERGRLGFQRSRYLVLDEADRMLDLGFEDQIDFIVSNMPDTATRQTFLYSATFPKPIQNLARRYLKRDHYLLTVGRVGSTTKNITQRILHVQEREKRDRLLRLILTQSPNDLVLVFVETKAEANGLWDFLCDEGIPTESIHGGRTQPERESALANFKSGTCPILVATDVASRGLDIPNVSHVVQYDLPKTLDDYTHRIGRTGRAGNQGTATSFFNKNYSHIAAELVEYLKEHEQEVPEYLEDAAAEALAAGARRAMGGAARQPRRQGDSWADARGAGGDSGAAMPQQRRAKEVSSVAKRMDDGGF
jgi:superfamily II DNA/RNA helicase